MFGTAAQTAVCGAGGSPNLPSNLLLKTLGLELQLSHCGSFPVVQVASAVFLGALHAGRNCTLGC